MFVNNRRKKIGVVETVEWVVRGEGASSVGVIILFDQEIPT